VMRERCQRPLVADYAPLRFFSGRAH
jgi:hypothetical protein